MATGATSTTVNGWSLEVVRGRDPGHRFALHGPDLVLGNAPGSEPGIDLAEQESGSPRRMAARQALLESRAGGLAIRDLESPGGTFVNRQRVLAGTSRPLVEGDVIQLGGVQLRVVADKPASSNVSPARANESGVPFAYALKSGTTCRNWDDFLVVAAQRWEELREELATGRLASFLTTIGRGDLTPRSSPGTSEDERLDAWLGQLPLTRPARAELDVHPKRLAIRSAGGGTLRRTVRVANVGHRLLRWSVRVEPPGTNWLRIAPEFAGKAIVTVEGTDLIVEIEPPASLAKPQTAALVIESNGSTARVAVVLERPGAAPPIEAVPAAKTGADWGLVGWLAMRGLAMRVAWLVAALVAIRLLVAVFEAVLPIPVEEGLALGLARPASGFAVLGGLAGLLFAIRRGEPRDWLASGFAGAFFGVIVATAAVALARTVEGPSIGLGMALGVWAAIGASLALLSFGIVPRRSIGEENR